MDEGTDVPPTDRLTEYVETGAHDAAVTALEQYTAADSDARHEALQALHDLATTQPTVFTSVLPELAPFLDDPKRSVRLTTAKVFVAVADAEPAAVGRVSEPLLGRLADDEEFYYVRARAAEALGYVARDEPRAVDLRAFLAELRVGLSFDEPEVVAKLAKALECVALGRPQRLTHHTGELATHLDDDAELVRYHLLTAIAVVGCERPSALADCQAALGACLEDESPYVRGRAAEALGLVARADELECEVPEARLASLADEESSFAAERARYALDARDEGSAEAVVGVGSIRGIREETEEVVADITRPGEAMCRECGRALPNHGPPVCPECGRPS
ncbi:HEAT repeat domain-containing protein [Halobacterium sp. CBA1126]|uniref:HEAT repeat domain-containing protein n=1 Tax=Halobacterium sp. CBA1126 TaxID=2668074 RepID=UPI0012FCC580|nr:HEAT repeat domain-containing protein [Halobacterium sp. CBA1126]MUV59645.1 hypothetical protein [Halobacterium sp. CBA1126]